MLLPFLPKGEFKSEVNPNEMKNLRFQRYERGNLTKQRSCYCRTYCVYGIEVSNWLSRESCAENVTEIMMTSLQDARNRYKWLNETINKKGDSNEQNI